jgi:hypothetical protein
MSPLSELRSHLVKVGNTLALIASLRKFFRDPLTIERAEEEIRNGLQTREKRFLEVMRARVYERPNSPYLKLLKVAGCDFVDLQTHVQSHGLERTLEHLANEGVYLTSEEFKGKKEIVRGALSFRVCARDFGPERQLPGFVTQSSGSNNQPTATLNPIEWITTQNSSVGFALKSHDLLSGGHAVYDGILPGAGGILFLLNLAKLGIKADRWFARQMPFNNWLEGCYFSLMTHLIVLAGKAFGPGFPRPELVDLQNPEIIVRWVEGRRRAGNSCVIRAVASNAARIAKRSLQMGCALDGTTFVVSGEPLTKAKAEMIRQAGAEAVPVYGYSGPFYVGLGCAKPAYVDEMHVDRNMFAVINHPKPIEQNSSIHPLLLTTLYSSTPSLQLNVANGDYAELQERDCGCALEKVGFSLHLHDLRSYEKFTSEGMNYFYGDLFELFEKQLPSEFGGGPGDYQLVEEEDNDGQTRLTLLVHPDVGDLNEEKLLSRLQQNLAQGSWNNRFMSKVWQNAGTVSVRRGTPHGSARGKILPLHINR